MSLKQDEKDYLAKQLEKYRAAKTSAVNKTADPNQLGREERTDHAPQEYATFAEGEVDMDARWEKDERYETGHAGKITNSAAKADEKALEAVPERERRFLRKKAALTVKVASLMLPNGNEAAIENQAVDLMAMPTKALVSSHNRLAASRTALKAAAADPAAEEKAKEEDELRKFETDKPEDEKEPKEDDKPEDEKGEEKAAKGKKDDEKPGEEGMDQAETMLDEALLLDEALEVDGKKPEDEEKAAKGKKDDEDEPKAAKKVDEEDEKAAEKAEEDEKAAEKAEEEEPVKASSDGGEIDDLLTDLTKDASGTEDIDLDDILSAAMAPEGAVKTASAKTVTAIQKLNKVKRNASPVGKEELVLASLWEGPPDVSEHFRR